MPLNWLYIALVYVTLYLIYRISKTPFNFLSLSFWDSVKLFDLLSLIPVVYILGSWINCIPTKKQEPAEIEKINGFTVDEATDIKEASDPLNRRRFVQEIASKIKNTHSENGSFPIGIVAKWGSGKTTFIQSLIKEFPREDYVVLQLNVWKCSTPAQTVETFFNLLKDELEKFSFTINNKIHDYTDLLLKGTRYEGINSIKSISDLFHSDSSIEKQYDSLNKEIKKIGKKIIITIDDLDRLDKREIYEVIRLIRNTANFSDTFFIVAYDRNYLLNAIEEINTYETHHFLEKIFQVEFALPAISDKIIQEEITNRINIFLTPKSKSGYKDLIEKGNPFFNYGDSDLTKFFIHNFRDVVRFLNSLKLQYDFVKDEIYFPDFYNLELIRFKHPELFSEIYKEHNKFITTDNKNDGFYSGSTLSLAMVVEDGKLTDLTKLEEYILSKKEIYKLSGREIDLVCDSFNSIFTNPELVLTERKTSANNHLTVIKPSMFDRYFMLGLDGNLSEVEFSKTRELSSDKFIKKLTELMSNADYTFEIKERFENIETFDDIEDFKK